jgi:hypothetical protein
LSGRRVINAVELKLIAEFLGGEMKELTKLPSTPSPTPSPERGKRESKRG